MYGRQAYYYGGKRKRTTGKSVRKGIKYLARKCMIDDLVTGRTAKRGRYSYNAPYGNISSWTGRTGHAITRSIGTSGGIYPDRFKTVLKWTQVVEAANTPSFRYVVRGNSVFDPGFTSGSSQPAGMATFNGAYTYYRVGWSRIKVSYNRVSGGTAVVPFILSLYPSITSNPFVAALQSFASVRYGASTIMSNGSAGGTAQYNPSTSNCLTNAMSTRKIFGDRSDDDSTYGSQLGTNPAAPWFFIMDGLTLDGTSFQTTDYFFVEVTFGVTFEAPVMVQV